MGSVVKKQSCGRHSVRAVRDSGLRYFFPLRLDLVGILHNPSNCPLNLTGGVVYQSWSNWTDNGASFWHSGTTRSLDQLFAGDPKRLRRAVAYPGQIPNELNSVQKAPTAMMVVIYNQVRGLFRKIDQWGASIIPFHAASRSFHHTEARYRRFKTTAVDGSTANPAPLVLLVQKALLELVARYGHVQLIGILENNEKRTMQG